jgi:hypothetical protein
MGMKPYRRLVCLVAACAAVSIPLAAASPAGACDTGYACVWSGTNYTGYQSNYGGAYGGSGWFYSGYKWSIKNRFLNRTVKFKFDGGNVACLNAGQEKPVFQFNWMVISNKGAVC